MPPSMLRTGLAAGVRRLRRHPALLTGLALAGLLGSAVHAQDREPVYSPDRPSATSAAPERQEAEWPARVGRIADVQGSVRLLEREDNEWVAASINRPVTSGDQFATQPGARLEISVGSATLRLDGDSELALQRLDDEAVVLQLRRGSLALQVLSGEMADQLEVHTREGRFRPREPGSYRIDRLDDTSHATAWRGTLRFEGHDSLLVVGRGQHAEVWLEGRTTHYRWAEDWRDDFAAWVVRDEAADARSESARYVSPEMTGWQDLDRHGRWETHPEHGAVWTPAVVPVGWAPYRSGHWAWIAPWGWTWIDDARWGFAPFHYGRWVYWQRRWCWVPGQRSVRPVYSPALVAWIGGGRVGIGLGGAVGWVPLGPRDVHHRHRWRDRDGWRDGGHDRGAHRQPVPAAPRTVPTGPVMYSNQGVPGAVTVVALDAFAGHRVVPVAGGTTGSPLIRGGTVRAPVTAVAPPPAPPRGATRDPADGNRRTIMPPLGREAAPAPEPGRVPMPLAPAPERAPVPAPERAMTPPRAVAPVPTPPVHVPAAPRAAPPLSAPSPAAVVPPAAVAPPRTPDAPRGQGPSRERGRDEERSGRQRGPEPRENMRERGQVR